MGFWHNSFMNKHHEKYSLCKRHICLKMQPLIVFLDTGKALKKMTRQRNIVSYQKMLKLWILAPCLELATPW